jgi:hypothetical protein
MTGVPRLGPTDAEMSLVVIASYETNLRIQAADARRRFQTVRVLIGIATLVFAYDVLSVLIGR